MATERENIHHSTENVPARKVKRFIPLGMPAVLPRHAH